MKPRKSSASISVWLHWLAGPGDARRSRSAYSRATGYFRPQLQVLEDRLVLSSTSISYTISDTPSSGKDATAKPPAVMASTTKGSTNSDAGQALALLIWADSSLSAQTAMLDGNVMVYAGTASYTIVVSPLIRGAIGPQIAQVTTFNFAVSFPTNSTTHATTTFQVTVAVEMNRGIAWWSQTSHPSANPSVSLAGVGPALSSTPPALASTPVVFFLPASSNASSEEAAPRPVMAVVISALVNELVALEMSGIPGARKDADYREAVLGGMRSDKGGLLAPAETQHSGFLGLYKGLQCHPAPSRAELHALTDKILAEAATGVEEDPDWKIGFSFKALLAFVVAESAWLGLRHLATTRAPLPAYDGEVERVGIWKKPK